MQELLSYTQDKVETSKDVMDKTSNKLESLATQRAGSTLPEDIKNDEIWCKKLEDGTFQLYRWTTADGVGDGTPIATNITNELTDSQLDVPSSALLKASLASASGGGVDITILDITESGEYIFDNDFWAEVWCVNGGNSGLNGGAGRTSAPYSAGAGGVGGTCGLLQKKIIKFQKNTVYMFIIGGANGASYIDGLITSIANRISRTSPYISDWYYDSSIAYYGVGSTIDFNLSGNRIFIEKQGNSYPTNTSSTIQSFHNSHAMVGTNGTNGEDGFFSQEIKAGDGSAGGRYNTSYGASGTGGIGGTGYGAGGGGGGGAGSRSSSGGKAGMGAQGIIRLYCFSSPYNLSLDTENDENTDNEENNETEENNG